MGICLRPMSSPLLCLLPEVQVSGLLVAATMGAGGGGGGDTLTTVSPTNPLIRWPELARSNLGEADGGTEQRDGRAGAKGGALRKGQPRDTPASITGAPPHDRGRSVTKIRSGVQRFLHIKGHDLDLRGITNCIPLLVHQ